jgi:hypothetical protein
MGSIYKEFENLVSTILGKQAIEVGEHRFREERN